MLHRASFYSASGSKCLNLQGDKPHFLIILRLQITISIKLRWLLARGRVDELAVIIEKACLWNNRSLAKGFKKTLNVSQKVSDRRVSIFDLFQDGYKLTTFLMTIIWFSIILTYFGITLHMSSLGGNIYVNTVSSQSHPLRRACKAEKPTRVLNKLFAINYKFH